MFWCNTFIVALLLSFLLPVNSLHDHFQDTNEKGGEFTAPNREPAFHQQAATQQCRTWFVNGTNGCECHPVPSVLCQTNKALLDHASCMTYYPTNDTLEAGLCPFSKELTKDTISELYIKLPEFPSQVNDYFCAPLNRSGTLCSECEPGLGPPVLSYSTKCVECLASPYGWLLYIFLACFPSTVLFVLVLFLQININSPQMNMFLLVSQYWSLRQLDFNFSTYGKVLVSLYSFSNLEFFRFAIPPFCVSPDMSLVHVATMEYLVASWPLFLVVMAYFCIELYARDCRVLMYMWRPFRVCCTRTRRFLDPKGSVVHAFATFLMLSYTKMGVVSFVLLLYVQPYSNQGHPVGHKMVYLDSSVDYCSFEHLPYVILSSTVSTIFLILPPVFLLLYPFGFFQRLLYKCRLRWRALHVFAEAFNGCYRNGMDNTRDCRYFGSFYMWIRIILFVVFLFGEKYIWIMQVILGLVSIILVLAFQPYRDNLFNILDALVVGVWTVRVVLDLYHHYVVKSISQTHYYVIGTVLMLYFVILVLVKITVTLKLDHKCFHPTSKIGVILRRFAGCQSENHKSNARGDEDTSLPHRLIHPVEYRPRGYGAVDT